MIIQRKIKSLLQATISKCQTHKNKNAWGERGEKAANYALLITRSSVKLTVVL